MIVEVNNFNYDLIKNIKVIKTGRRKNKRKYLDIITAFDIEASNINDIEQAIMYIWQFQIDDKVTVIGRCWSEFVDFYNKLNEIFTDETIIPNILKSFNNK